MRWILVALALLLGAILVTWGGWYWVQARHFRRDFARAEREFSGGFYQLARDHFADLMKRRPKMTETAYQLGLCEEILGHTDAAMKAWSGIEADSPVFIKAALGRALLLLNSGKFSQAEDLLWSLPRDHGAYAGHVQREIELLLRLEGREKEARWLIVESWPSGSAPSDLLFRLFMLEDTAFPIDYAKAALARGDPNDDRLWLGRANLASWCGRYDEAARWLDSCERSRPEDQAVWHARLSLAMATGDYSTARGAIKHLKAIWLLPAEVLRLRAWFAAFRGDAAERQNLLSLVALEPGHTAAWARLAELAIKSGHASDAVAYRGKQAEMGQLHAKYKELTMREDRDRFAGELARLAKKLGRGLEARGWSLIQEGRALAVPLGADLALSGNVAAGSSMLEPLLEDVFLVAPEDSVPRHPSTAAVAFTEDAVRAGLRFLQENGGAGRYLAPPVTMSGGVGLIDFDGDGWLDVYTVQGGTFPPDDSVKVNGDRLFRNLRNGTFDDVSERAGITSFRQGYGHGVAVGDFDNDGWPDLFVTRWKSYALYRNRGDGRFEDVTEQAGLGGDRDWPTSAAFADLDNDGDLDLYVCHYLQYDPSSPKICNNPSAPMKSDCLPRDFPSLPDHVFRNESGRFVDVTDQAGIVDQNGRGLGVLAADLDDDNKVDLLVANDMSANYFFHNLGEFRFAETGEASGVAASADGLYKSGMGIACGDLDGDGCFDLAVTNFFGESTTFYQNLGRGLFIDHTALIGLQGPSRPLLGFGIAFPDINNDGWLDLLATNGHVLDGRPRIPLTMPLQLMTGRPGGFLTDVSVRAGEAFRSLHLGRGLAVGDLDNDGRLDAVVINQNEQLVYLHNRTEPAGHFIRFRLEGTKSNRDAVGARVTIACGGRRIVSQRLGGSSYQSSNDPRLHIGVGHAQRVESVEVRWPSGQVDYHQGLIADREYRLREGEKALEISTRLRP
jgi:tetratricopeptide (TPR) repeat protein